MEGGIVDRSSDDDARLEAVRVFAVIWLVGAVLTLAVAGLAWRWPIAGYQSAPLAVLGAAGLSVAVMVYVFAQAVTWTLFRALLFATVVSVSFGQVWFAGTPSFAPVAYLWMILGAFGYLPRRQAVVHAVWALGWMAVVFAIQPGWPNPFGFALFLGGTLVVTAWFVSKLVARAEAHAEAERQARKELATLNETLETRVADQVDELGRLDRLRRFLSPSIADAVVSEDSVARLAPHRALIAALFCDLRGFTSFSSEAEPEDVTSLLGRFHDVMGPLVDRYEATVGGFVGDGVALYFNDPIPCDDPAVRAVRLALDLEEPMAQLATEWRRHGFEVGYGVGIALGYATLGIIGIEHRREYTAIGSVMNLASRLSDDAKASEILLDSRAAAALQDQIVTEPIGDLTLKGFARPVAAYRVVARSPTAPERVV